MVEYWCEYCRKVELKEMYEKSSFGLCSGCRVVRYCSTECQKQHWSIHKPNCKEYGIQVRTKTIQQLIDLIRTDEILLEKLWQLSDSNRRNEKQREKNKKKDREKIVAIYIQPNDLTNGVYDNIECGISKFTRADDWVYDSRFFVEFIVVSGGKVMRIVLPRYKQPDETNVSALSAIEVLRRAQSVFPDTDREKLYEALKLPYCSIHYYDETTRVSHSVIYRKED